MQLGRFQHETGHQMAVVTVARLNGRDVTEFTTALAKRWGVGRKGVNDGIVVLVAPADRTARISVGLGLEEELPDSFCREVMNKDMVPQFAEKKFDAGVQAGVSAIIRRLASTESNGS